MKKNKSSILAAAVTGIFLGTAAGCVGGPDSMQESHADKNGCSGKSSCNAKGSCKAEKHACNGKNGCDAKNECKGKGSCEGKK